MAVEKGFIQPSNPTNDERHSMLKMALEEVNRREDFKGIIKSLYLPEDIYNNDFGNFRGLKVAVIGGGLAGLASSFELRKLGFDITLFEANEERIGGRVYTYYFDKQKKLYGELGAMRIPVAHESVWYYINLFGLKTRPFVQNNPNAFIYIRNTRVRNDSKGKNVMEKIYPKFKLYPWERILPWQKLLRYGLLTPMEKMSPDIREEILQIKRKYSFPIEYWTGFGIRQVLEQMGLSQGAIQLISSVVPYAGQFYNNSYFEILQEEYPVDFSYMYEIVGGTSNLPQAFLNSLLSIKPREYGNMDVRKIGNFNFKKGKRVIGIYEISSKDKVMIKYHSTSSNEVKNENFDFVICTIPLSSLRTVEINPMFSTKKMQALKEVNYSTAQKTLFLCNRRFWEEGDEKERILGGGSFSDLPITSIWYPSDHAEFKDIKEISYREPGVLLASYAYAQDGIRLGNLEEKFRIQMIKRQIEEIHGLPVGYMDKIVEKHITIEWNKERYFYGGFCYFMPNQLRLFIYNLSKPEYNNKVYFAGEHVSTCHGWMQGAINTGVKAAIDLANYCKINKK